MSGVISNLQLPISNYQIDNRPGSILSDIGPDVKVHKKDQSGLLVLCAACHGITGEGTALVSALNDPVLRNQKTEADLMGIISNGVPGTLMIAWNQTLSQQEISELVTLIRKGKF